MAWGGWWGGILGLGLDSSNELLRELIELIEVDQLIALIELIEVGDNECCNTKLRFWTDKRVSEHRHVSDHIICESCIYWTIWIIGYCVYWFSGVSEYCTYWVT